MDGYISEIFYEGRLGTDPSTARQALAGLAADRRDRIRWEPVAPRWRRLVVGRRGGAVTDAIEELLGREWTDRQGDPRPLGIEDIVVVAPYNAHVAAIEAARRAAPRRPGPGRDGRPVPGPGGAGRDLLDGGVVGRGCPARHDVPVRRAPPQRRGVPGDGPRDRGRQPRPPARRPARPGPDAPGERDLPSGRGGRRAGRGPGRGAPEAVPEPAAADRTAEEPEAAATPSRS